MITISRRGIDYILGSCFFFLILLFISDGCKSDSGPTSVTNTYPTVAPNWRGSATLTPGTAYSLTAAIGQSLDKVGGVCSGPPRVELKPLSNTMAQSRLQGR